MFKRTQREVSDGSKHWYQDKYQHVLTQRNLLALIALVSLFAAAVAVFAVMRLAPLKTVEPYLIEIDEKTGVTQKVIPISRKDYVANDAVDRYFTALYIRMREGYNYSAMGYNYNTVKLLSTPDVFRGFWAKENPRLEASTAGQLGSFGLRSVKIRSMAYISNPAQGNAKAKTTSQKIIQANVTITQNTPNTPETQKKLILTITFDYADRGLDADDQLINPLGYTVISYQVQEEN